MPRLHFIYFFTAHALRLQMSLPFPIYHFRCCAAPAPFSAAFRIDLSIVLHMQYPWPYPQWPPPCTAPTTYCQHSATTMAPFSNNGTYPYCPVSSTTTDDLASLSGHFAATTSSYVATSHANTSSTGANLCDSHTRLLSTTSDAGT